MRGRRLYKRVFIFATDNYTGEQDICYSGHDLGEARYTVAVMRRMDAEGKDAGHYNYIIKGLKEDGTLERWK